MKNIGRYLTFAVTVLPMAMTVALPHYAHAGPAPFTTSVERCIIPAANYHGVNQHILRAILKVESGLKPNAIGLNDNGTKDVGIGQMNSMHFKELATWGVAPSDLLDECIGTYVAAWHLRKVVARNGNTWYGIATYHSATPYFNKRYQALLFNELVRTGVMDGPQLPVPPLKPGGAAQSSASAKKPKVVGEAQVSKLPSLVLNE